MKRVVSLLSSLLMVAGIGLLVYVGISYERSQNQKHVAAPHWNAAQQRKGKQLAKQLTKHQRITVPKRMKVPPVTPGSEVATRIVIPKIDVNSPVVQTQPVDGVWNVVDWEVGQLASTPNPGAAGNIDLAAHDDIKGEIFKRIGQLGPGDKIQLYTRHAVYTYVVTNQQTVDPSDTAVLEPQGHASLVTLVSCTPYWVDTQRIIVQAALKSRAAV